MQELPMLLCYGMIIFLTTWIPVVYHLNLPNDQKNKSNYYLFADNFSCGIFLGVGFIHLLPDSESLLPHSLQSIPPIIAGLTLLLLLAVSDTKKQYFSSILPLIMLSVHSLFSGMALGLSNLKLSIALFIAIIAHKWAAAFALMTSMLKQMQRSYALIAFFIFSIQTPLGICIGNILKLRAPILLESITLAIASGTLIYMALHENSYYNFSQRYPYLIMGFFVIGILAFVI